MMIEKILLFSICLIMMEALNWIIPVGAAIVIGTFIALEIIKTSRPKTRRKPSKPKSSKVPLIMDYSGGYKRK